MSHLVRVYCPNKCEDGTLPDGRMCGDCLGQGHKDVNPEEVEQEGLRVWVDKLLPEFPHATPCD